MATPAKSMGLAGLVAYSPPIDLTQSYNPSWVGGKTILITGGASGFGEGFSRKWAEHGANIIIGDVNKNQGRQLVEELRKTTGHDNHHYLYCDVSSWQSQVDMFRSAVTLSLHGRIDAVVANAGVKDDGTFEKPQIDAEEPPRPNWRCLDVNLIGVLYTAHLAMYYLSRNPQSDPAHPNADPSLQARDRHLLLIGSLASLTPAPSQMIYGIAKHGVMGLFRQLRIAPAGMRVNMICPYFMDTSIIPTIGRLVLAGGGMGKPEDVVEAGTRFVADPRIMGRALAVGPKVRVDEHGELVLKEAANGRQTAIWEVYADDFEETELFTRRIVRLLNQVETARGWVGWAKDVCAALYGSFMGTHGQN